MVSSKAETVAEYLDELPDDRRDAITQVRTAIVANLPAGIVETMSFGMIAYEVPLDIFADTYNKKPLLYAALASQKNHMAVYLHALYADADTEQWFSKAYAKTGLKADIGKSCVRFKKVEQLPVDLIGEAIAKVTADDFVASYLANRS